MKNDICLGANSRLLFIAKKSQYTETSPDLVIRDTSQGGAGQIIVLGIDLTLVQAIAVFTSSAI
jgi:hypothetical protein